MAYTIDSIDLQEVTERFSVKSNLDIEAFPMSGTKNTLVFDYDGVVRKIEVEGKFIATTEAAAVNFAMSIDALQDGNQGVITYHSDKIDASTSGDYQDGEFSVKISSFTYNFEYGEVVAVNFRLSLVESI